MVFTVSEKISGIYDDVSDTSTLTDGSEWELIYDIKNPQTDFVAFCFEYTQDASSNFTIQASFESAEVADDDDNTFEDLIDVFYQETKLDDTTSSAFAPAHSTAGAFRINIPVTFASNRIKLKITPDVATGSDTLICFMSELTIRGKGRR